MGDKGWVRGEWGDAEGEWGGRNVTTLKLGRGVGDGGEGKVLGGKGKGGAGEEEEVWEEEDMKEGNW